MPLITAVEITDSSTITFTGIDFPLSSAYSANATFGGVMADEVNVVSATSATAKWNFGVPVVTTAAKPDLFFWKNSSFPITYTIPTSGNG